MSKNNKKDKKGEASSAIQQAYEMQKRQLLDCQFTIKKLQQRLNDLTQQNVRLKKNIDEAGMVYNDKIQELTIKNMANQKRLLGLSNQKTKLEIQNEQKQNKLRMLQKNLFDQQQGRVKDVQQCKKNFHFQLAKYESQLSEYKLYMNERDELQQQRQQLRQKIQIEKANKLRQVADKERQKVQATDKLKDEMLHKINDMRKNLFSLKREQLSTTTRLTMLQNHQLTSELQYQSKQTQKLIFKNEELQQKITSLKQQLDIHKQVQQQLAKRSHFSKGVIRKLNLRINQLQGELQKMKNEMCLKTESGGNPTISFGSVLKNSRDNQDDQEEPQKNNANQTKYQLSNLNNKRLISTLEMQLQKSQKKYVQLLTRYQNLQKQKQSLIVKLKISQQKANQLFKLMKRYYDEVLIKNTDKNKFQQNNPSGIYHQDQNQLKENILPYQYNLSHLRDVPIQEWKIDDVILTIQILLNIIQPYLTKSNLVIPSVRKNIILVDNLGPRKSDLSCKSLPKLSTQRKQIYQNKVQQIPVNLASKIVSSNLRDWGKPVKLNKMSLTRKYKIGQTYRG